VSGKRKKKTESEKGAVEEEPKRQTSFFNLAFLRFDLLLFDGRSIGIEAAELLCFLPGQDAVFAGLVFFRRHFVLFDERDIVEICLHGLWAVVYDL
jgi:hypothetical protein